jgi:peroxiredoxin
MHTMRASLYVLFLLAIAVPARAEVTQGKAAEDFSLPSLDGKKVSLSSLRGKVVLVDFWASWCGPCKQELPELEKLLKGYAGKDVAIITINLDKDKANAADMAKKLKITLPVGLDPDGKVAEKYEPPTMPSSYVVDKAGVVRHRHEGFRGADDIAQFKKEIDELLAR